MSPCYTGFSRFKTACALRIGPGGRREVAVPGFDLAGNESCTAVLDMAARQWTRVRRDGRHQLDGGEAVRYSIMDYHRLMVNG